MAHFYIIHSYYYATDINGIKNTQKNKHIVNRSSVLNITQSRLNSKYECILKGRKK